MCIFWYVFSLIFIHKHFWPNIKCILSMTINIIHTKYMAFSRNYCLFIIMEYYFFLCQVNSNCLSILFDNFDLKDSFWDYCLAFVFNFIIIQNCCFNFKYYELLLIDMLKYKNLLMLIFKICEYYWYCFFIMNSIFLHIYSMIC